MVDALNRDHVRVQQGGTFPRYPNWATCKEMDRCVALPVRESYLDVSRLTRRQSEIETGHGPQRLVLGNTGGNPNSLPASNHPDAPGMIRRQQEKGQKGHSKGQEPPWRRSEEWSSRSGYEQRNADWSTYNAAAMRTNEPGSSSSRQSDWYWDRSRAGWVDRNEQQRAQTEQGQQSSRSGWDDLSQNNDQWGNF